MKFKNSNFLILAIIEIILGNIGSLEEKVKLLEKQLEESKEVNKNLLRELSKAHDEEPLQNGPTGEEIGKNLIEID